MNELQVIENERTRRAFQILDREFDHDMEVKKGSMWEHIYVYPPEDSGSYRDIMSDHRSTLQNEGFSVFTTFEPGAYIKHIILGEKE